MNGLRVVFMGTPDFSVGIMRKIQEEGFQLVGCVTVADKPAGRGQQMHESPVKRYAVEQQIPVLQPVKLKDPEFLEQLASFHADVFVVVAFRMLPAEVWKMPAKGTFNLHASLLPDYRGAAPINWAIINGDQETGVSTFFIDEAIDTGNVIGQTRMTIHENETAGELHDRMIVTGGMLVADTLRAIESGTVKAIPQAEMTASPQRPAPKLFKENTSIQWDLPAKTIHQLVCGLSPYPAAWSKWTNARGEHKMIKFFRTTILEGQQGTPGSLSSDKQFIYVSCQEGTLVVHEFQVEGKKRMTAKEWLVGNDINDWKTAISI